ncbi:MAG TPA: carboxymuconolactone decarboxylase family protein [Patescibacteria group bacterium]|nr:carboxymuconolactone decarboxylase family protein [Patescibacteria group bacterium]
MKQVRDAFTCFMQEAPEQAQAWMDTVKKLDKTSALDSKTEEVAYIAVLAASGLLSGIPFHVKHAKELGVSRDEIKSAILLPLPAVGNKVISALPIALAAYDNA